MLKKLRNKIVLTNMLLVFVLLLVIGVCVSVFAYNVEHEKIEKRLEKAIYFFSDTGAGDFRRSFGEETPEKGGEDGDNFLSGSAVVILLNSDNEPVAKTEFSATMSDTAVEYSVNYVLKKGKTSGYISTVGVEYLMSATQFGTTIAFTDRTSLEETVSAVVITSLIVFATIMAVVFVISIILASLAVKPVDAAWTAQKQFIADASHELKTPLTVILANTNILESHETEQDPNPDRMQWIESTKDEATRMKKLIEEMLYLAKSDTEEVQLTLADTDISEIAERTVLTFEPVAFEKNVEIRTAIQPELILKTEASMLERLLYILIDNAVKHAEKGTPVKVSLGKAGGKVTVLVNNRGDIISSEDIPHIFDRFYKADKARTADSADNGFGLGLSIAKSITSKLGGTIEVTSNEQYGTTFRVQF